MAGKTRPERMVIPDLAIKTSVARARLDAVGSRSSTAGARSTRQNVGTMLTAAADAAHGRSPRTRRLSNWWKGTLNDVGYRSLHAASAELAGLLTPREVRTALPEAIGRIQGSSLPGSDPRRLAAQQALARPETVDAAHLRQLITIGYEVADDAYARVRSFRNVVWLATALVVLIGGVFVGYVMAHPAFLPLCFDAPSGAATTVVCPTSQTLLAPGAPVPTAPETPQDILLVCLLGLLGATLSATVSLRKIRGSSDPYSVPVALTALKVPTGALTAIVALIAIQAGFVPGLSSLDSQAQIIAYALLFGYAQQVLTGLVDRQGASVLAGVPNKIHVASPAGTASSGTAAAGAGVLVPGPAPDVAVSAAGAQVEPDEDGQDSDDAGDVDDVDDSDLPDLYPQDVAGGEIEDDGGTLEELPDEELPDGKLPDGDPPAGDQPDDVSQEPDEPDDVPDEGEVLPDEPADAPAAVPSPATGVPEAVTR
jgi:hypothetical protein